LAEMLLHTHATLHDLKRRRAWFGSYDQSWKKKTKKNCFM